MVNGIDFNNDNVKSLIHYNHVSNKINANWAWRCCGDKHGFVFGGKANIHCCKSPLEDSQVELAAVNHFKDTSLKAAAKWWFKLNQSKCID